MTENEIAKVVVDAAIEVHRTLGGPGLLETVYEEALAFEQALTYLRLSDLKLAIGINFGEVKVRQGIHRIVNGLQE
ncbi:GxxExxY protein [Sorangium sp. So ce119]|uniref:GxxExxY protein n=1 Tax=Sorangium sp. So ce119 TaxID=3133279 RepID=UPI003F5E43B3